MNEDRPPLDQLRDAFVSLSVNSAPGPDCPAPDSIWTALSGEASVRATNAIVEHTSRCYACAETWRLGAELSAQRRAGASAAGRTKAFRKPAFGVWAGLAAAALVLVVAGIGIYMQSGSQQQTVTRAGAEAGIESLVPEMTPLPRAACVLKWSAAAAGARYSLRIGMQDLTPIVSVQGLEQTEYQVPIKNLENLSTGATIIWRVEATLPDGRRIASQAFMNRVE